jgi:hypothetical protein
MTFSGSGSKEDVGLDDGDDDGAGVASVNTGRIPL